MRLQYPIETMRLHLEPFQESDGDALYVMERDPEVKKYAGGVLTREQSEKQLKKFIKIVSETGWGPVAIKLRGTNLIIGLCGFYGTPDPNEAEIFYGLARDAWGQGYATEAAKALAVAGIQQLGLSSIIAPVNPENVRSIRVLEKIGMSFSHISTDSEQYEVAHVYYLKADPLLGR
jgi:RimJ/RimL family protein N-acetyltransferase